MEFLILTNNNEKKYIPKTFKFNNILESEIINNLDLEFFSNISNTRLFNKGLIKSGLGSIFSDFKSQNSKLTFLDYVSEINNELSITQIILIYKNIYNKFRKEKKLENKEISYLDIELLNGVKFQGNKNYTLLLYYRLFPLFNDRIIKLINIDLKYFTSNNTINLLNSFNVKDNDRYLNNIINFIRENKNILDYSFVMPDREDKFEPSIELLEEHYDGGRNISFFNNVYDMSKYELMISQLTNYQLVKLFGYILPIKDNIYLPLFKNNKLLLLEAVMEIFYHSLDLKFDEVNIKLENDEIVPVAEATPRIELNLADFFIDFNYDIFKDKINTSKDNAINYINTLTIGVDESSFDEGSSSDGGSSFDKGILKLINYSKVIALYNEKNKDKLTEKMNGHLTSLVKQIENLLNYIDEIVFIYSMKSTSGTIDYTNEFLNDFSFIFNFIDRIDESRKKELFSLLLSRDNIKVTSFPRYKHTYIEEL